MPNIRKVTKEEISWQLSGSSINAGSQANARIKEYLGDDSRFFAPMTVTSTGYTWTSQEPGWIPLASASDIQRDMVETELANLRNRIQQKLSLRPKLAEEILSLPSDDGKYVFFMEGNDGVRFLITGWGFSNARRKVVIPGKNKKDIKSISSARIGFAINGELRPNHRFLITTMGGAAKECFTDAEGFYHLGEQKANTKVNLIDGDSQKTISFEIEDGKSDYVFDITRNSKIRVIVSCDETLLENAEIIIGYHGNSHTYTTDSLGEVNITLPFFNGEIIETSTNGIDKRTLCQYPETEIQIQLTKPKEKKGGDIDDTVTDPPVKKYSDVSIRCINQEGNPRYNYPITIRIGEYATDFLSDKGGLVSLPPQEIGTEIKVIDGFEVANYVRHIVDDSDNIIELIVPEEVASVPDNTLQMIGIDGNLLANRKVILRQGDKTLILNLDGEGTTRFNDSEFEHDKEMTAQILAKDNEHDPIPFTLDENERNYVIQELEATKKPRWHKFLNIVLAIILISVIAEIGSIFVQHLPYV